MIIWCDFIDDVVVESEFIPELFGFMNDEYDNLGFIYVGF